MGNVVVKRSSLNYKKPRCLKETARCRVLLTSVAHIPPGLPGWSMDRADRTDRCFASRYVTPTTEGWMDARRRITLLYITALCWASRGKNRVDEYLRRKYLGWFTLNQKSKPRLLTVRSDYTEYISTANERSFWDNKDSYFVSNDKLVNELSAVRQMRRFKIFSFTKPELGVVQSHWKWRQWRHSIDSIHMICY